MKRLFVFAIVLMTMACTNVEKYYFVYSDGEWVQVEENPMVDKEQNDPDTALENGDNEAIAVNDDGEVIDGEDVEIDSDLDEENPEEILPDEDVEETDETTMVPDDDFCDEPCIYLYDRYDGYLGKDKENGEIMRIWIVPADCQCEAQMILEYGYRESFFGYTFPMTAESSNTLNTGNIDRDIVFTSFSTGEERYFEEMQ